MKKNTKNLNTCPKANRCKFGEECINFDTFLGEYLCFSAKAMSQYVRYKNKHEKSALSCKERK